MNFEISENLKVEIWRGNALPSVFSFNLLRYEAVSDVVEQIEKESANLFRLGVSISHMIVMPFEKNDFLLVFFQTLSCSYSLK